MIRNFENTEVNSAFPPECKKPTDMYLIKTIFFVKRTYSFASVSDFQDLAIWIQAIKDGNIIPVFDCLEFVDISDADPLEPNSQDYLYLKYKGKYKFVHKFNYNYDYAKNIKGLSQSDFDYIFADRSGNIVAYTPDGTEVRGFETDSITVEKLNIGTVQKANTTNITVELSDTDQLDLNAETFNPEWSISQNLRLVAVEFSNMDLSSMSFTIKDSVFKKPVNHLMKSNFVLSEGGGITFNTFKKLGDGQYYLNDFSSPPVSGEVEIDSRIYYGSGVYGSASVTTVNMFAFEISISGGFFWVKLTNPSGDPITGRVQSHFSWDSGTTNYFSEEGSGVYRIGLLKAPAATTGTLTFDDGNYSGSSLYDVTLVRVTDTFGVLREDALNRFWPYSIGGANIDVSGSYQLDTGKWRVITTFSGDTYYVNWNRIDNADNNRITIDISAISSGELKFVNGANSQAYTTPGIKTFDWTGDGANLILYMNSVNCLIADFKIENF